MKAHRGLLHTDRQPVVAKPRPAALRSTSLAQKLLAAPGTARLWRDVWEEFRMLANHRPDLWGRRIYSDLAVEKARYVARVAHRAVLSGTLPGGRSWSYLFGAIRVVYHELEHGT